MSNTLRRSPRLSQHYSGSAFSPIPTFSTSTSTTTSSQPSPTTDPFSIAAQQEHLRAQLQAQFLYPPSQPSGPLPSPSAADCGPFFGSEPSLTTFAMPEQGQAANASSQQSQGQQAIMQGSHTSSSSASQNPGAFGAPQRSSTTQSIQSQGHGPPPGILAEAAKRAQMACLMRDLGDVSL